MYDALGELQDRRLCIAVGEGRRVMYQATSPDRLLQEAEKQRIDALDGVSQLMRLYDRSPAGVVEVIRGSQNVIEDELRLLRDAKMGDYLDIVGGEVIVGSSCMMGVLKNGSPCVRRRKSSCAT